MKLPISQMPGASNLIRDYLDDFDKVAEFYNGDYRKPENFLNRAAAIKARDLPLSRLVPVLKEQNQLYGCTLQTLEKIDWLLERRACAVVSGQQTGLFSGPIFTIYKALTAIKLAARLSRTCDGCYVPVFWLASDDHDFREANHTWIMNKSNEPLRIEYGGHSPNSKLPVGKVLMDRTIEQALAVLAENTHPSDYKDDVLASLKDAYQPETSFSTAFGKWLMALFKSFGLIIIDASEPRIKTLARKLFAQEIADGSPSSKAALEASRRLAAKNYHAQVEVKDGFLNLFYAEQERASLQMDGRKFTAKSMSRTFAREELLSILETNTEFFSPNVMLRPLYQDILLPTMAYVAGPSEIAYYAQMKGIYEAFGVPMPVIYPRKSLTLIEPKIEKVLESHGLEVVDFFRDIEMLINEIAKAQMPDKLDTRIENTSLCVAKNLQALEDVVAQFEPTLIDFVKNTRGRIQGQIQGMEKKILQAFKKRNDVTRQQLYKAANSLYPGGVMQERRLNILPYLFKYGFGFVDQLYEAMDISNFDHQIVRI